MPAYERDLDHAGLLRSLDGRSYRRGEAIYGRVCASCHGTREQAGSMPTSLCFAEDKFKNGADPFRMYQTLTHGFGMITPQTWMVPEQKYDVIHFIREAYLKPHNPGQYTKIDDAYLAGLPKGASRGPRPSVTVSADGRSVTLAIEDLKPAWDMEIRYDLRAADGSAVKGLLHNTIHRLGD